MVVLHPLYILFQGGQLCRRECFLLAKGFYFPAGRGEMNSKPVRDFCALFTRIAFVFLALALPLTAQERASAPRADGQTTPLLVYRAAGTVTGCAPLAVISHGAGGSENGYRYLAEAMAQNGFTTVDDGSSRERPVGVERRICGRTEYGRESRRSWPTRRRSRHGYWMLALLSSGPIASATFPSECFLVTQWARKR